MPRDKSEFQLESDETTYEYTKQINHNPAYIYSFQKNIAHYLSSMRIWKVNKLKLTRNS